MVGCWAARSPTCFMEAIIASTSSWVQWLCHIQKTACDSTWLSHICRLCHRASSAYSCEIQCNSFSNNRNYYLLFLWLWQNTPTKATQRRKGYFSTQFSVQPIMVGRSQQQELEAAAPCASIHSRKLNSKSFLVLSLLSGLCTGWDPLLRD